MKKISIIKNGQITNQAQFETDELLNEWLNREKLNLSFGYPERELIDTPNNPVSEELKSIATEVNQVEVGGTIYNKYKIPSEFTVEIEDITEEVNQKQINEEAELFLKQTDWMVVRFVDSGTPIPEEIKQQRALARAKIVR